MSIRLLIADDHAVFRSGLRALLEKQDDLEVVAETGNGPDTLAALSAHEVDVLLLDISLPELPGPRVAEAALAAHPLLVIVVLTMHEEPDYLREMFRIGVKGYVLKKSTGTELEHAIRVAYAGNTYIDPALAQHVIDPYVGQEEPRDALPKDLLSRREQEVCRDLALGFTNAEVAERLFISRRTVETHRNNIMKKLDLNSRAELVRFALDAGFLQP